MSTISVRVVLSAALLAVPLGLDVLPSGDPSPSYAATTGAADGLVAFGSIRDRVPAIWVMGADGSAPHQVTSGPDYFAAWSPDSTRIAFARYSAPVPQIHVLGVADDSERSVTAGTHPTWSPDGGSIAYELDGDIWVVRASGAGAPRRVTSGPEHDMWPDWSPDGRTIAFARTVGSNVDIYSLRCDRAYVCDGEPRRLTTDPRFDIAPAWSPDGSRIAFRGGGDVFVMNGDGSGQSAVTTDPGFDADPTWGPDGATLAFATARNGNAEIYRIGTDGTREADLGDSGGIEMHPDWQVPWRAQAGFSTVAEDTVPAAGLPRGCAAAGPTTGGALAEKPPLVVSTAQSLISAATAPAPRTILVRGVLDLKGARVKVASHRTIRGIGAGSGIRNGGLVLHDVCDVIVQNLAFGPAGAAKDVLRLTGRTFHVWIDHNTFDSGCDDFNDCYDGLLDAREEVDLVTVSWNTFRRHGKVALVLVKGNETKRGAVPPGADDLRMTYHHNRFENVGSRSPQFAFGTLHAFANVWSNVDEAVHCHSGARCLVEHNVFANEVDHPLRTFDSELCKDAKGCAAGTGQIDLNPAVGRYGLAANTNRFTGVDPLGNGGLKPVTCKKATSIGELNFCDIDPAGFGYAYASYVEPVGRLESVLSARAGTTLR